MTNFQQESHHLPLFGQTDLLISLHVTSKTKDDHLTHISTSNHQYNVFLNHLDNLTSIHLLFHTAVDIWKSFIYKKALLSQATFLRIIPMKTIWQLPNSFSNANMQHDSSLASDILISLTKAEPPHQKKPNCGAFCDFSQQTKLKSRHEWHHTFQTLGSDQDTCKINHKLSKYTDWNNKLPFLATFNAVVKKNQWAKRFCTAAYGQMPTWKDIWEKVSVLYFFFLLVVTFQTDFVCEWLNSRGPNSRA